MFSITWRKVCNIKHYPSYAVAFHIIVCLLLSILIAHIQTVKFDTSLDD